MLDSGIRLISGVFHVQAATAFVSQEVASARLFFLDPVDDEEFAVVFGGFERCASNYQIDRGQFPWYALEFVSHGSGTVQLGDGGIIPLQPGSFFIYGPALRHRIVSSAESPLGKYFVGFTGAGVEDFLKLYGMEPGFVARCVKSEPVRRGFDTLIDRGIRKTRLAWPLCAVITRQLLLMCRDDAADPGNTETAAYTTFVRGKEFIETNFLEATTLEAISTACDIDAPYLCRLFSRFHDESPYQYLTRLRMEHASRILLETDASVKAVAAELGFKDAFHFSRVFKSVHHVPPSRFRQSMHPQWP